MRSSGPAAAGSRDWANAITRQVPARRKRGIVRTVAVGTRASLAGLISRPGRSEHVQRRMPRRAWWSCPFPVRALSGPVAAREVHEAATDHYPGQEGREPPPGFGLLDHSEHLRLSGEGDARGVPPRSSTGAIGP